MNAFENMGNEDDEDDIDINSNEYNENQDDNKNVADTTNITFDPKQLSSSVAEAVASQLAAHTAANQQQKQMTPQELAEHYAIWDPSEGFVNELNALSDTDATPAQKKKIVEQMRDGIMQQAFRAAQLVTQQELMKMRKELAPAVQYAQERQAKNVMKEFSTKYPALQGQTELVDAVIANLSQQNFTPKSKDEAYEKVATIAESILKKVDPKFSLKTAAAGGGKPSMARTNMSGVGGGGPQRSASADEGRGKLASFWQQ